MALTDKLTAIADAIRSKAGTTDAMTLAQMPDSISGIETGITPTGSIDITDNGTYDVTDKASAVVNVSSGGGGATEPYIEETYNANGKLIGVNMHGYTRIRMYAFYGCDYLTSVSLHDSITYIDNSGFESCSKLALTSLPDSITYIGTSAFSYCTNLALTSLPKSLTYLGVAAFRNCSTLSVLSIPSGVTDVLSSVFYACGNLTSVTFNGTPTSISSSAFTGCANLTTINVPWSEGAVANAPWDATNATINYDYTGE